jgi:hypothetical protein
MFNYAMSVAAFGFVAFVLVFVHPASQTGRATAQQTGAGGHVATADPAVAGVRSHLAASK